MVKKTFAFLFALLLFIFLIFVPAEVSAFDLPATYDEYEEYDDFTESIPDDVKNSLPQGIFDSDGSVLRDTASPRGMFGIIWKMLGFNIKEALRMFSKLCFIVILAAVFKTMEKNFESKSVSEAFSVCTGAAFSVMILGGQTQMIRAVSDFLDRLCALVNSMIPLIGVLCASGGNVSLASGGTASLSFFILVCENFCGKTLVPMVGLCTAFAVASVFSSGIDSGSIAGTVKRTYTFVLGLFMTVMGLIMSAQTTLASRADSLSARAVKYAVGTYIPVVGGSIGESLRTVGACADYIRSSVGTLGIVIIIVLLCPTLLSLVFTRLSLAFSAFASKVLGLEREAKFISELENIYGYMIAVCSVSSVLFIYALTLFVRSSSAM